MISFIKRKLKKAWYKRKFEEYGYKIKKFPIDGIGEIEYAQWQHPLIQPHVVSTANVNFYSKLAGPGAMIIDIGAHAGDTTVPMALAVGKEGLVLGLEPNKYVFKILKKNASLNPELTNIVPLCFAATDVDKEFVFHYSDASFGNGGYLSQLERKSLSHRYTLDVVGKNLQNYLFEHYADKLEKLELLKVDAEGYDKEILKTLPDILERYKPNLMVECYKKLTPEEREELFDVITGFGYHLYRLENFEETAKIFRIEKENMMDQKHLEILGIHRDKEMGWLL